MIFNKELFQQLQSLTLISKSVKDCYKKMEIDMVKANIVKDKKTIITRFFNSSNRKIPNIIELHYYITIENMAYMVIRIERQLKKKDKTR